MEPQLPSAMLLSGSPKAVRGFPASFSVTCKPCNMSPAFVGYCPILSALDLQKVQNNGPYAACTVFYVIVGNYFGRFQGPGQSSNRYPGLLLLALNLLSNCQRVGAVSKALSSRQDCSCHKEIPFCMQKNKLRTKRSVVQRILCWNALCHSRPPIARIWRRQLNPIHVLSTEPVPQLHSMYPSAGCMHKTLLTIRYAPCEYSS